MRGQTKLSQGLPRLQKGAKRARREFESDKGEEGIRGGLSVDELKRAGAGAAAPAGGAGRGGETFGLSQGKDQQEGMLGLVNRSGKRVQQVGSRAFYLQAERWVEGGLTEKDLASARHVAYLSDEYFDLLSKNLGIGEVLSVGEKVTFRWNDAAIAVD